MTAAQVRARQPGARVRSRGSGAAAGSRAGISSRARNLRFARRVKPIENSRFGAMIDAYRMKRPLEAKSHATYMRSGPFGDSRANLSALLSLLPACTDITLIALLTNRASATSNGTRQAGSRSIIVAATISPASSA